MAIPKFFHLVESFVEGSTVSLDESEARHASQARRLSQGDSVMLLNGQGAKAVGVFTELTKKSAQVRIEKVENCSRPEVDISIASAIPKGDRQKTMIDMLTQLGVSTIIPLQCEFSASKVSDKLIDKWNKVAIEACKQSENPFTPTIKQAVSLVDLIDSEQFSECDVYRAEQFANSDINTQYKNKKVLILVGPEGGFSDKEIELLDSEPVSLLRVGEYILRTETAAVSMISKFI